MNGAHIYQCSKGHVICPKCKQKLQSCPQCREVYGTVGIRNLILESIIVKLKPKSQIQKKSERKKHGNNHGGEKRVIQLSGYYDNLLCDGRNQFVSEELIQQYAGNYHQIRQHLEQLQQTQSTQQHNGHQMSR